MIRILIILLFLIPTSADAQSPQYKSGLNHTRVYNTPKPAKPDTPDVEKPSLALTSDKTSEEKEETAADRVWKKYKSIAMGEHTQNSEADTKGEKADSEKTSQKETASAENPQEENAPSKAGFAAILDSYNTNKKTQRDMRSISFKQPKTPVEKNGEE